MKVYHAERLDACHISLRKDAASYAVDGPLEIVVVDALRIGFAAQIAQLGFFNSGKSGARDLKDTPHGRGAAWDFGVVRACYPSGGVMSIWLPGEKPELYDQVAAYFVAKGQVSGKNFKSVKGGDVDHLEVADWRSLPFPPKE